MEFQKVEIKPGHSLLITVHTTAGHKGEIIPKHPSGFYFNDENYVFIDVQDGRAKFKTVSKDNIEGIEIRVS